MTKKKELLTIWAILLGLTLMLAACGPAVSQEEAERMTREAETTESADAEAAEMPETEAAPETEGPPAPAEDLGPVTETDSGLKYHETTTGEGASPQEGDIVTMNVIGTLEDGTVFVDTYSQGQPIVTTVDDNSLFPGWKEGLLLMKEGGKTRMVIPPELAFGEEGGGGIIPPNATIIMDVELLEVTAPPTPTEVDAGDFTTTESGLQYYDLVEGDGDVPVEGQDVVVNYVAWLQDGNTYIASSEPQGEPYTFRLGDEFAVFPGWNEGVSTMKVGGKRQLIIPPDLALGEQGGGRIPPNATLIMEIELLEAKPLVLPTTVAEEDFTTTDSGLKYFDLVEGDGPMPEQGQLVTVDYTGWLTDNVKFDSSLDAGQPFSFVLGSGGVIEGWEEGVATMKVGGKRQLVVPADLAYGDTGAGGAIPPGATLIFEIELLEVADEATP